jgi:hypothetical protein
VRKVLSRFSVRQIQSAMDAAIERERNARNSGNVASADIFKSVADECASELRGRLLIIATRDIVSESQKADRETSALLQEMTR